MSRRNARRFCRVVRSARVYACAGVAGLASAYGAEAQTPEENVQVVAKTPPVTAAPAYAPSQTGAGAGLVQRSAKSSQAAHFMALDLPLKCGGFYIGDVPVRVSPAGAVMVSLGSLAGLLKKIVKPDVIGSVFPQGNAENGSSSGFANRPGSPASDYVPVEEIGRRGLALSYDAAASELTASPLVSQKQEEGLSLGTNANAVASANAERPAFFSAYVNTRLFIDYLGGFEDGSEGIRSPSFEFDGAMRLGPLVLENEASLAPRSGLAVAGQSGTAYDAVRRGTRLVYDREDQFVRYKLGDFAPAFAGFQSSPDLFGISAERSYSALRPGQSIRTTAQHTFQLDRPANVDVLADGVILRRLHLQAGTYNINDLPLNPGATKTTLAIEDDTGERRTLEFTNFAGDGLLAPGVNEWQVAAGVLAERTPTPDFGQKPGLIGYIQPDYRWAEPAVTGFYKTGLTSSVTGGAYGQAAADIAMAGGSVWTGTPYGYVALDGAASLGATYGAGFAGRAVYELSGTHPGDGSAQSLRLSLEYRSDGFSTVGAYVSPRDYATTATAVYARDISEDIGANIAGSVFFGRDDASSITQWNADFTVSQRFSDALSGAVSFGYGDSGTAGERSLGCACQSAYDIGGLRVFARLNFRPNPSSSVLSSYDAQTQTARLTYTAASGQGIGAWNSSVDVAPSAATRTADAGASISYSGNRGDVSLSHATRFEGLYANPRATGERTSLRIETGLATADGAVSFGRPIGNSFAIVEEDSTLSGRVVSVGGSAAPAAHSDGAIPVLIADIRPYVQRRVEFDVADLPPGYDLGTGAFDFLGPYKAGYRVKAGSGYTVTAMGRLLDREKRAVSLVSGTAQEDGKPEGSKIALFTNASGRFGAQGLAPGRWIIEMATEPSPTRFALDIPPGTSGLFKAGDVTALRSDSTAPEPR